MSAPISLEARQWGVALRWLARADEDLAAAEMLLAPADPLIFSSAFHCHQAVEKMAKAVLVAFRIPPPKSHNLKELGHRVSVVHHEIGTSVLGLAAVMTWYVTARYPDGDEAILSATDLRLVLPRLRALRRPIDSLAPQP